MEELDDWGLSAEELNFLEEDAIRKISERKASSAASSSSPLARQADASKNPLFKPVDKPPSKTSLESRYGKVEAFPPQDISSADISTGTGESTRSALPTLSVRFCVHESGAIAAKFSYHALLVDAFHKIPKTSWHAKERLWMFPLSSLAVAEEVLSAVNGANVEVEKLDVLVHRALGAASAVNDLRDLYDRMPSYLETKLLPFQREGVRFILQHGGRVLLADEMGLGKTLQAIAVAACMPEAWPVLVITPSSLRIQWAFMIQQWLNIPFADILVVLSQSGGSNKAGFKIVFSHLKSSIHLDGVFNIVSYDVVPKIQDILLASEFKIVVADESHFMKNAQAKRTNACIPILKKAQYAILLSGTPALSRPIELFKQLEALHPNVYKNVHEYGNRYCKGGFFGVYQGASNHEELHSLLKATVMIRRLKRDVLSQLPVKRRQQVFLDLNESDMKQIRILFRELEVVKMNIQACNSPEKIESLKFMQKNLINKIFNDSAEAKVPAVLDYLGTVIEAGCKFLIFAHHQHMIDAIHQFLLKKKVGCIRIDGGTPPTSRQAFVADFQEKDSIKAAVLSIRAGGVGLTLTAASTVIFAELSWTPGDIIQAEDRAHRIGQVSSVNIYYLLANDTVDDIIWDVVQNKLENVGQVLDGQENTLVVSSNPSSRSPHKQLTLDANPSSRSPHKQLTLDAFMKRCQSTDDTHHKTKSPKI
ncbi:SWI/SNF-related matrix-associated actin-dependent regulator of chromatin subfamily A-like protein 1 isoform X1 [Zingiber officinale]|uniref:SWI/SNF-related matrix-associated actin-dependent regulator of chromatin subfamily A-like protein 1 isoform X1 n=2 Tax=Zingiber officinale TaxID=94328 RepID=UPI001C4CB917|nr:SWI/SNF-related matrix-associated actin-dependent regulator of chromatin subfamily A-like protein 1 isoform X1 [Zingiber officinale]